MRFENFGKINKFFFFFFINIAIFTACSDDYLDGDNGYENTGKEILMTFHMPNASTPKVKATRSISDIDENKINDIDVLAFRKTPDGKWIYNYKSVGTNIVDAPDANESKNKKQFSVEVLKEDFEQQFVIIANAREEINNLDWSSLEGKEKEELLSLLVFDNQGKWNTTSSSDFRAFPMWGETGARTINESTKTIGGINVLRAISRVDLILSDNAKADFKLTDVYIYNTKTKGYIVPFAENFDVSNNKVIKAQVPTGLHNDYDPANPNAKALQYKITTDTLFERSIYLLEAAAVSSINDRDKATCLVVGGKYKDGQTTWYRIDLFENDASGKVTENYKDLLRNHQYRFNISNVSGPGHPNPETAFKEKTINMIAEVKVWDDGEVGDIIFDEQHYISINPSRILEFGKEESQIALKIKTDVLAGFKITKITDAAGNILTDGNLWFSIGDYQLNNSYGTNEKEESIPLKVKENTTGAERVAYMYMEAGRMNVMIKITQSIVSLNLFQFVSMENVDGKGLAIPRVGGQVKVTVNSNIPWKLKGKRGENEAEEIFTPSHIGGEAEEATLTLNIDPISRFWKDDYEVETDINVWIEYELNGQVVKAQENIFYQVLYDFNVENTIPSTINRYGDYIEVNLKGLFPEMLVRVVDGAGNCVSDIATMPRTGDIVNNNNFSSKVKFLVYSNYSGSSRDLYIQYERPIYDENDENAKEWKELSKITQESNGLKLPTTGYKATRGVLGIGARTGKLRLDGSYGLYGGTATYIDKDGVKKGEDVYMVCFMWGSLVALHAPKLEGSEMEILLVSEDGSNEKTLGDIIAWLPPGFNGDIDLDQGYMDLIPFNELHLLPENNLTTGYGDPCRSAQNELSDGGAPAYGSYRMPWGTDGYNQEAYNSYGDPKPELETTGAGSGYYYLKNTYYAEELRQYIPAYGLIYSFKLDEDNNPIGIAYMADNADIASRRDYMAYWASTTVSSIPSNDEAYIFSRGSIPSGYPPYGTQLPKFLALPIRCVK